MTVPFERYHGTGNEFVVVDAAAHPVSDRSRVATRVCDPDDGLGVDGVLFLAVEDAHPLRVEMRLFQPDGGTAAMCGNGARCAARWTVERTGGGEVVVDTPAGPRRATVDDAAVTVEMGAPSFDPADVPLAADRDAPLIEERVEDWTVTAVNTGVPHAVAFVDDAAGVDVAGEAPPVRRAEVFPEGANVTLASPRADGDGFDQRTFERGVEAETRSCGTGAVAVVAAARRTDRVAADGETTVAIHPPGGRLDVSVGTDGRASLRGPAVRDGAGELDPATGEVEP